MRRRTLLRFVISYLLVLIIPIAAFLVYFRVNVMTLVHERLDADLMAAASNTALVLESELLQLLSAARIIQETNAFTLLRLGNPRNTMDAQAYLRTFAAVSELVSSAAYYPFGSDRVYTSTSPLYPEVYISGIGLRHSRRDSIAWIHDLQAGFHGDNHEGRTTLYAIAIPTYGEDPRGVLIYELDRSVIHRILSAAIPHAGVGRVSLLFGARTIAEAGDASLSVDPFAIVGLGAHGLSLVVYVDESARVNEINRRVAFMAILIGGLLLVCMPLVYVFSMTSANPLAHLSEFLHATLRISDSSESPILEAERAITSLLETIDESSDFVRRELLTQIIRGSVEDWPEFSGRCRAYGIDLAGQRYTVVIVTFECSSAEEQTETLCGHLAAFLGNDYTVMGFQEFADGDHALIVTSAPSTDPVAEGGFIGERLDEWAASLSTVERCRWSISVGSTVESLRSVPQSYLRAKSAQDHRFVLGFNRVLRADELLSGAEATVAYPRVQLECLSNTVAAGDVRGVHAAIRGIFHALRASSPSLFLARCVSYDAITTLINSAGTDTTYWRLADAISLAEVRTVGQMEDLLVQVGSDLCELVAEGQAKGSAFDPVVTSINLRICDPTLSAKSVATEFGLSLSNFSHQFRRHTGATFQAYLAQKRIAEAKRLLVETDDTLNDVVRSIGYGDTSSFIKKFRAATGVTPTEYRRGTRPGSRS